jgi:cellulose synthase (UDP-forming)
LSQDYPPDKIRLVISDDAHRAAIRFLALRLQREVPQARVFYHEPYRRGDPRRRGEAKAGNLNSVLEFLDHYAPGAEFIETRDADDVVGDPRFLRQAVGQLVADPQAAYVQTIKDATVSPGDPFGNREPLFYRRALAARYAANAICPCGSGLVWRRVALAELGGFPVWNLVEDLQSGLEALRRGWRGLYLPLVGAVGQTAPEDVPNAIKQRGTWALDAMRLCFWGDKRGLNLRQQLQFAELGLFYMLSLPVLVFAVTCVVALAFDVYPLVAGHAAYAVHFWPYALTLELLLASLGQGLPFESLWRARQTWLGMAPVYAWATLLALVYGPRRKPAYRVTRKDRQVRVYWRETLPQVALCLALALASAYHLATHSLLHTADLGSLFWAAFFILGLSRTVRNGWYGVYEEKLQELRGRAARSVWSRLLPFRTPRSH